MARLITPVAFEGSLGNITAYKVRGSDKIILRTKGGPSRQRIRTSPEFELVRKNNAEFGGRAVASKWIMRAIAPLKSLADHNLSGKLNALLKPLQDLDTASERGKRHVQLSRGRHLLTGFSMNRGVGFEAVLRAPLSFSLSRIEQRSVVEIPALLPDINFFPQRNRVFFSVAAALGIVPDLFYNDGIYETSPPEFTSVPVMAETSWLPVADGAEPMTLTLSLSQELPEPASLMLSIGIRYGIARSNGVMEQLKHVGAAKVLGVV